MGLFDIFDSREKKKRLSHMFNLLAVACADGVLEQAEIDLLLQIGKRMGVSYDELKRVIERPGSVKFTAPETNEERIALLYDMVLVMMVNGDIDEGEVLYCKNVAQKLGFSHKIIDIMVNKVIELVKQGVENEKAVENLLTVAEN
ncbi:MAG TPA: hypothetical protein PK252_04240 [Bacteroidales bacterium]|nr:hypothetical protein [Bacteroidales bacterium]